MAINLSAFQKVVDIRCGINMETGAHVVPNPEAYPLKVYAGSALQSYIAGSESPIPESNPATTQHLLGFAPGCSPVTPTLDSENAYNSTLYATDKGALSSSETISTQYTGLMRLAVQAKSGSNRSVSDLAPWTISPATCGLLRSDTYEYFAVHIDSTGCTIAELEGGLECVRDWLARNKAGTLTLNADDVVRWEAYLMATLKPARDENGAYITHSVLTSTQLESVYNGRAPLCNGWHFSRGWENECSIVAWRNGTLASTNSWYWETTLATVDFDVNATTPTATLTTPEADQEVSLYWQVDKLWYPSGSNMQLKLPPASNYTAKDTSANNTAIYCFYDDSGLQVVRHQHSKEAPAGSWPSWDAAERTECGEFYKFSQRTYSPNPWRDGSFSVGSVSTQLLMTDFRYFDEAELTINGGRTSVVGLWQRSFVDNPANASCQNPGYAYADFATDSSCSGTLGSDMTPVTMEYASGLTWEWRTGYINSMVGVRMCLISGLDPDAVYLVEGQQGSENWTNRHYTHTDNILTGFQADLSAGGNTGMLRYSMGISTGPNTASASSIPTCNAADTVSASSVSQDPSPVEVATSGVTTRFDMNATLITGKGSKALPETSWSAWSDFAGGNFVDQTVSNTLNVSESFNVGDISYYEDPATVTLEAGYHANASQGSHFRWGGWV